MGFAIVASCRAVRRVLYEMMFVDRCVSVCEPSFVVSRDRQITMWLVWLCSCVDACFVQSDKGECIKISHTKIEITNQTRIGKTRDH